MLTVSIPPDIQQVLRNALRVAGSNECGGVLMAEHVGPDQFVVRRLTVQGGGRFASFVRGTRSAFRALGEYFRQSGHDYTRFNYLGEWHSHPSFSVQPSRTDHNSMLEIVTNPKVGANFVVLLIFKLIGRDKLEGSAHTYLPNGTIAPTALVLEGTS